jgi:PTS system ascorbate-specific IIA component
VVAEVQVAVALVTHAPLGSALKSVAEHIFGGHVGITVIDVLPGACADDSADSLVNRIEALNNGAGVLLLTDLPGASPANVCLKACLRAREMGIQCEVVAGVNAAMVLRAVNYRADRLPDIVTAVIEGASQTIKRVD